MLQARAVNSDTRRLGWVDALRASAILLMVAFHFCYDLRYFGYVDWDVPNGPGWWQLRYLILTLFLGTVGISLSLAHGDGVHWRRFAWRWGQIALSALAITLMSLVIFPDAWIYFGILHFIALASLLCLPLIGRPRTALALGLVLLLAHNAGWVDSRWPFHWLEPWLSPHTEDFVPLLPWLGLTWLGLWLGDVWRRRNWPDPLPVPPGWVAWPARHSLLIYLVHQPLLFALFFIAK